MWSLCSINNDVKHKLLCNKDIVVGRKDTDIVLAGDSSVSRKHAVINIIHHLKDLKNPSNIPSISVTDHSKFGTFFTRPGAESTKVNRTAQLSHGDTVQFGAQRSVFKLQYRPLVVTTSMLDDNTKARLQDVILKLGGHLVNSWHDKVTHVVMKEIKLSVKVTQALAHCSHIVHPDFIFSLKESISSSMAVPIPEEHLPKLAEPNLSSEDCCFKLNQNRKNVFAGRTFVYLCTKQLKRLGNTVTYAGGKNIPVDDASVSDDLLVHEDTCVIFCSPLQEDQLLTSSKYEHVQTVLLGKGRRFVQEHEIGLAVLYCDASVYCNSTYELNSQNIFTQSALADRSTQSARKDDSLSTQPKVQVEEVPVDADTGGRSKKRMREDDATLGPSNDQHIQDYFTELAGDRDRKDDIGTSVMTKKAKLSEEAADQPISVAGETHESDTMNPGEDDRLEDIPDSCLDDDNLWSQNFDSASFTTRKEVMQPLSVKKTNRVARRTPPKAQAARSIKAEIRTPSTTAAFPRMPSAPETNGLPQSIKEEHNISVPVQDSTEAANSATVPERGAPPENGTYDPSLPSQVTRVTVVPLLVKRNRAVDASSQHVGVKNFKRFRKVWPTYMDVQGEQDSVSSHRSIPRIIGGKDFFINRKRQNHADLEDWFDEGVGRSQGSNPFAANM